MGELITARELGERLMQCGDVPVKLRTEVNGEYCCITLMRCDSVVIAIHSASGTEWGDLAEVVRLDVAIHDNA